MNEIEYYENEEMIALGQHMKDCLEAILSDNGSDMTVAALYRSIYKYTECGPWLSVLLHDGTWRHCGQLEGIDNGNVRALLVGSIVEGSDAEVKGKVLDLINFESPEDAVAAFNREVEEVNAEACALWDEANNDEG